MLHDLQVLEIFDPENSMTYYFNVKQPVISIQPPHNVDGVVLKSGEAWGYLNEMLNHRLLVGDVNKAIDVIEEYDSWVKGILGEQDITISNNNKDVL